MAPLILERSIATRGRPRAGVRIVVWRVCLVELSSEGAREGCEKTL